MLETPQRFWSLAVGIAALVFAAIAPTLLWLEFSNSAEALNVATAMEMRRGDSQWLVPSLQGETRLHKPPLTAWITATSISQNTMQSISSLDPRERERGYLRLAWQSRWPGLLAGCVMLLATAAMGRMIAGPTCGIVSIVAAGSSLLFLRFSRYGTTDIQLAMWVSLTNLALLHALLNRRTWSGFMLAGICLGLAFMSKGPVALAQSVAPVLVWLIYARRKNAQSSEPAEKLGACFLPIMAGALAFLLVAIPWFAIVLMREPGAWQTWLAEITRRGATESKASAFYAYLILFPYASPWFVFMVGGAIIALRHRGRRELLPLFMVVVPILIMSLAKDRNERYLLPMLPAASILVGIGVTELLSARAFAIGHWITLAAIAIGFPIAAMFIQPPWYPQRLAIVAAIISGIAVAAGIIQQRWIRSSLIFMTLLIMLGLQALFISGYRQSREGSAELRPMADNVFRMFPTAEAFNAHPRGKRPPPEVGVYLNRIIQWTDDPSRIAPGENPKVLFMLQEKADPPPTPPPGWRLVETRKRDKDFWWVFVLPPTIAS